MRKEMHDIQTSGIKDYGIVCITGEINEGMAEKVCEQIIEMNMTGEVDQIQLLINSPGGAVHAGFAILDMMEWSRLPVYTTGIGRVASMGLMLLMAGDPGRRVVTPRTSILSHRFSAFNIGKHSELLAQRKEQDYMHSRILEHYMRHSGLKTPRELEEHLLRDVDTWLTPQEAVAFGLVDLVEPLRRGPARTPLTTPAAAAPTEERHA